jgi:curved DNA-binding protein CbpA
MPDKVQLKGSLENNSLPSLLNYLSEIKSTGTLTLSNGGVTKKLFIKNGGIVFASSTYEGDRLGELMLKAGKINMAQFDAASKVVVQTGKRMGGVMVELGYIKPKDLFWGVKYQVQEIVCSLFAWTEGVYEFNPGEHPTAEVITLHMSTANLILQGIKRIDDWTRISRGIPSMDSVLTVTSNPLKLYQDINLSTEEKGIISLFDGKRTIKDVFDAAPIGDFEALKAVYVLYTIGIVERMAAGAKPKAGSQAARKPAAAAPAGPTLDKNAIHKAYIASKSQNFYEVLGVDTEASNSQIETAYQRLARQYHPDQQFREGMAQLKDELGELFSRVTEAYKILSDDSRRWEYDLSLATVTTESPRSRPPKAIDPAKASEAFAKGIDSFKGRDFESATVHFKEAARLDATKALYMSHLALALLQRPRREAEAEEAMLDAIRLEPNNADHQANLGLLYQKSGIKDKAKEAFEAALKIDPENKKAIKGLKKK